MGINIDTQMEGDVFDTEKDTSDDDDDYDDVEGPWISMGMTKEGKHEARKPWRLSLIIKLVGRSIGYQFPLRRL